MEQTVKKMRKMTFRQVQGNTWLLEGYESQMVYRLGEQDCILFDTGYPNERESLLASLEEHKLNLVAVVCTHAHIDHIGSAEYLRQRFQIPFYLSQGEAGVLSHLLNSKVYRSSLSPKELKAELGDTPSLFIQMIPDGATTLEIEGVSFGIEDTRGHSTHHLAFVTPDDVCFLGDALLAMSYMDSKFPYALDIAGALETHEGVKHFPYSQYILSHQGVIPLADLEELVNENQGLFLKRAKEICHALGREGLTLDQLALALCQQYHMNARKAKRILLYQRTIRYFLEYLEDKGDIIVDMSPLGVIYRTKS